MGQWKVELGNKLAGNSFGLEQDRIVSSRDSSISGLMKPLQSEPISLLWVLYLTMPGMGVMLCFCGRSR